MKTRHGAKNEETVFTLAPDTHYAIIACGYAPSLRKYMGKFGEVVHKTVSRLDGVKRHGHCIGWLFPEKHVAYIHVRAGHNSLIWGIDNVEDDLLVCSFPFGKQGLSGEELIRYAEESESALKKICPKATILVRYYEITHTKKYTIDCCYTEYDERE